MGISGAIAAAIFDPATGTVVQFNHVATDSEHTHETASEQTIAGAELYAGEEQTLALQVLDLNGRSQLEAWQKGETPLQGAVAGLQENILFREAVAMQFTAPIVFAPRTRPRYTVRLPFEGVSPDVQAGINLLWLVDPAHAAATYDIVFPVAGVDLTLSADGGTGNLELIALDYAGTQLDIASAAAASRASVSLTLPANTWTVRVNLPAGHTEPALRTDGNEEYFAG